MSKQKKITYKSSGVDVNLGYKLVDIIKPFAKKTLRKEINSNIGSFAALASIPKNYKSPKLVACTDGVGTKISIAEKLNDHSTVGEDLVAMCVNDLITVGAEPLFFLDYLVTDKINLRKKKQIFKGISKGCLAAGCSLIGGETAEHPDEFPKGKYDLAGFSVGVAEKNKILKISNVKNNDLIYGLSSTGLHSNGFSLIRKLIQARKINLKARMGKTTLGKALLKPTKIYVNVVRELSKSISLKQICHITGGGIVENLPRVIPNGKCAHIDFSRGYPFHKDLFDLISSKANLTIKEMTEVFNCGVGLIVIIHPADKANLEYKLKKSRQPFVRLGKVVNDKTKKLEIQFG